MSDVGFGYRLIIFFSKSLFPNVLMLITPTAFKSKPPVAYGVEYSS